MVELFKKIAQSDWFSRSVTIVIFMAAVVVGIETYPAALENYGPALEWANRIILFIFTLEVIVKMGAEVPEPWRYFYDPWNVFDFLIVGAAFLPLDAQFVTVLRLVRLLRVLKLVRALPKLQILVSALLKSIPSMGYVSLLLLLLFYLFAVTATFLFSTNDPVHFANLQTSMLTLFRVVTLEDWTDVMYIQMFGCDDYGYSDMPHLCTQPRAYPVFSALFFVTFVLLGTMIVLNLFVGVIMNGMDEAQKEQDKERQDEESMGSIAAELTALELQAAAIQEQITKVRRHLSALDRL